MNGNSSGSNNGIDGEKTSGSTMPVFSGAFEDDSNRPTMATNGQPVPQYVPPMYGQPVQQYPRQMYGQPVPQYPGQVYGQPVPQYPGQVYGQPVYVQPVTQYQVLPKKTVDRKLFRKHCSRVGLMLMADVGLMTVVEMAVLIAFIIVLVFLGETDQSQIVAKVMMAPLMIAGGISAIVGNMTPSGLHPRKGRYTFKDLL